jgi:argininosuccinate lyase
MREVEFDFPRMQTASESGFMNAMAAATYLVSKGVAFRKAHEQIGNAVRYCLDKGCELQELSLEELQKFGPNFADDFYKAVTIEAVLACHDVIGGTNPARVKNAVATLKKQIEALRGEVHAHA